MCTRFTFPSALPPHPAPPTGCWFFQLAIKYGVVPDTVYMIHINTLPETKCAAGAATLDDWLAGGRAGWRA